MVLTETVNFAIGSALFIHVVFKSIVSYVQENKMPCESSRSSLVDPGGKTIGRPRVGVPDSLPSTVDIKKALPNSCFQSQLSTSMFYCVKDFLQIIVAYALLSYAETHVSSLTVRAGLVLLYWAAQGTFFMAMFVLGHDCGHGSFSVYPLINDIVGTISHAVLMVPYYQWKLSHRNHHKNTGNIDKDEVFYPVRRSQNTTSRLLPGFGLGIGWFVYLIVGYSPRRVQHFNLWEPMFEGHFVGCLFSLLATGAVGVLALQFYLAYGLCSLLVYYIVPLFLLGSFIVVITFLHHAEVDVPWYSDDQWTFVRGQLSSVDRHYGIIHEVIHCIGTHQMHHMFTRIPHYHLEQATAHFRRAFPHLVRKCDEPILPSFVRMFQKYEEQSVIGDDVKIHALK